ncbi:MAG: class I SAM-dependent methyltransferase [Burkholderiales bacterium]|nr:class I SAM-dependent methyltransferase [Burkholderiales bacterium]
MSTPKRLERTPQMADQIRPCPLCAGIASRTGFPFAVEFDGKVFNYVRCGRCLSVFVDPVPDAQALARMYARSDYHDCHYAECQSGHYSAAARLLRDYAPEGATVLDYGCGLGHFLHATRSAGFNAHGVEFDAEAAEAAALRSGCPVIPVAEFERQPRMPHFDVVHLGDVLEHLPDPTDTQTRLLECLRPGGLLFVEGPLEENPSPVYWASRGFGTFKRWLRPGFVGRGTPTHLFRTSASPQLDFFRRVAPGFELLHWEIYETGWPYDGGGLLKRMISRSAMLLGGKRIGRVAFGNRFTALFRAPGGH